MNLNSVCKAINVKPVVIFAGYSGFPLNGWHRGCTMTGFTSSGLGRPAFIGEVAFSYFGKIRGGVWK